MLTPELADRHVGSVRVVSTEADEALVEVNHIVRALIAAQVRDPHLVDDLTQETLVRVASARPRLADSAVRAYAIVTARSVIASHFRAESVAGRHAHRLVDHHRDDGPEHLALAREETDAIAVALGRLQPAERELLLRYEAGDVDLDTLAADHTTSPASITMRLSRARAALRLEFLLAFRRIQLPKASCRAVLLALSTGDRRRQNHLNVAGHLLRCPTCSGLARPATERNRGIAGWLIAPAAEFVRRTIGAIRRRPTQVAAGVLATAAIAGLAIIVTTREQPEPQPSATNRPPATAQTVRTPPSPTAVNASVPTTPVAPTAPARTVERSEPSTSFTAQTELSSVPTPLDRSEPSTTPAAPIVASSAAILVERTDPSTLPPTTMTPPCGPAQPLDAINPNTPIGCPFAPTTLNVVDVPLDEGFWATTAEQETVLVQLIGPGESPVTIEPGMTLTIAGVIAPPPPDVTAIGLADDDPHIAQLVYYLEVRYQDVQTP